MYRFLLVGAVLAVSACNGGSKASNNAAAVDTSGANDMMMMNQTTMDQNASANAMPGAGANGAVDANTQNMMMQDANTHDRDTNLANGI